MKKILIADDEPNIVTALEFLLERSGYEVLVARNGGAAVLVSTHMLDTAQKLCDRILILRKGVKIAEGTLTELQERAHAAGDASLEDVFLSLTAEEAETTAAAAAGALPR